MSYNTYLLKSIFLMVKTIDQAFIAVTLNKSSLTAPARLFAGSMKHNLRLNTETIFSWIHLDWKSSHPFIMRANHTVFFALVHFHFYLMCLEFPNI